MGESMARNTSYEVQKRYESKSMCRMTPSIEKDLVFKFKALCDKKEESYNSIIKKGIIEFLKETENINSEE